MGLIKLNDKFKPIYTFFGENYSPYDLKNGILDEAKKEIKDAIDNNVSILENQKKRIEKIIMHREIKIKELIVKKDDEAIKKIKDTITEADKILKTINTSIRTLRSVNTNILRNLNNFDERLIAPKKYCKQTRFFVNNIDNNLDMFTRQIDNFISDKKEEKSIPFKIIKGSLVSKPMIEFVDNVKKESDNLDRVIAHVTKAYNTQRGIGELWKAGTLVINGHGDRLIDVTEIRKNTIPKSGEAI